MLPHLAKAYAEKQKALVPQSVKGKKPISFFCLGNFPQTVTSNFYLFLFFSKADGKGKVIHTPAFQCAEVTLNRRPSLKSLGKGGR